MNVVGVVPASGASRRMGEPKALLEVDGATFVAHVVTALGDGGCSDVVVVCTDDPPILAAARETGAGVLINPAPGEGPITSMRLALRSLDEDADAIAWLPVDFPRAGADVVRALLAEVERTGAPIGLPVHRRDDGSEKRGHPAVFSKAVFGELLDPRLEGGARTVVHRHLSDALRLPWPDAGVVTDVDTPAEYEALLREAGR